MEDSFIVEGGKPLIGEVQLSGAKNIALKVMIAALLFEGPVELANIPHIRDIEELISLIKKLGGKADFTNGHRVIVDGRTMSHYSIDLLYGSKVRVSYMFFAPLLSKFGKAIIPNPGGCRLGARDIDRTIDILKTMGAEIDYISEDGYYHANLKNSKLQGTTYRFQKPTHTGTELAIMLASRAHGDTIINNASLEPEIDDLISFLNASGAKIKRDKDSIYIKGVEKLISHKPYSIQNDRNEAVTYACLALATKGNIVVKGASEQDLRPFIEMVKKIKGQIEVLEEGIRFSYTTELLSSDITVLPHPGFMTDWQGPWAVLMTQARGESTIHETIYENRFAYVKELRKLGAKIKFFQPVVEDPQKTYQFNWTQNHNSPQAIRIYGPKKLHNGVMTVADLRAGATLLIAATVAKGQSILNGASTIERGYEHIVEKITQLGGTIKKV